MSTKRMSTKKIIVAIVLMWIGLFFTIQALTFAGEPTPTHGQTQVIPSPWRWPFCGRDHLCSSSHYRCEKASDGTTITFTPIEADSHKLTLSCTNCECTGAK